LWYFVVVVIDGGERGGDENEYLEKRFLPHGNYIILEIGHINLLYKIFHMNSEFYV